MISCLYSLQTSKNPIQPNIFQVVICSDVDDDVSDVVLKIRAKIIIYKKDNILVEEKSTRLPRLLWLEE